VTVTVQENFRSDVKEVKNCFLCIQVMKFISLLTSHLVP